MLLVVIGLWGVSRATPLGGYAFGFPAFAPGCARGLTCLAERNHGKPKTQVADAVRGPVALAARRPAAAIQKARRGL
ncbi:MAG TPA: hypothetical protein VMV69_18170 [Pirellulales bacterium]|nr:hypothetical protein [Pirellulales bacterium]